MADARAGETFLAKAEESLAGAESELANGRYNNVANRAYYSCFQAAVGTLVETGIGPSASGRWDHDVVQAQFVGDLINRRHRSPADLLDTFERLLRLRQTADYRTDPVTETQAERAVRRARTFVEPIKQGGGRT